MIIVDKALQKREEEGNPIRVAMVGAGFMGRGIAYQICNFVPGMRLVAIANRNLEKAAEAFRKSGISSINTPQDPNQLDHFILRGQYSITIDPLLLCEAENIDAIIEVTGSIEFGAQVVLKAIQKRKHVIVMNAELDGTIGPILKIYADSSGVIFSNADGDQPGVLMNLYRFVKNIGCRPVLAGNIKGLHDPYRNPDTQQEFARKWNQKPQMVTSFADGTKISFEQTVVANATGMHVAKRGMFGFQVLPGTPVETAAQIYPMDMLTEPGIVDYVVGAAPSPGVFILGFCDDPFQQKYLDLYKLGSGPYYCFYRPYHLCHFEVPFSVARAVIFHDATITPLGPPVVGVVAAAKIDLRAGMTLDGCGGYLTYGLCENYDRLIKEGLLPMGLSERCVVTKDIGKDQILTFNDIQLPEDRLCDRLYQEQTKHFELITPDPPGRIFSP